MKRSVLAASALSLVLAACGGGGGSSSALPSTGGSPLAGNSVKAQVTIVIPPKASTSQATHKYVSPSTQSISVAVDSGTPASVNLTPGSSNCTAPVLLTSLTCTVPIAATAGSHSITFVTYDGTNATGNALSTNTVTQTLVANQVNNIAVTLNGIPTSFSVTPISTLGAAVDGNVTSGFTMTDGVAVPFIITPLDADGNAIVGPGTPAINVTATGANASNFTVTPSTNGNPNQYSITSAVNGMTATLALSATPLSANVALTSAPFYSNTGLVLPSGATPVQGMTIDSNGTMYGAYTNATSTGSIISFNPSTPTTPYTTISQGSSISVFPMPPIVINGPLLHARNPVYNAATNDIYFYDYSACSIYWISNSSPTATLVAGNSSCAADQDGTGNGAEFDRPNGMVVGPNNNLFVTEQFGCDVREVTTGGVVSTVAGTATLCGTSDNTTGTLASFSAQLGSIAYDSGNGKLYVGDNCAVRSVDPNNNFAVVTIAGTVNACGSTDGTGSTASLQRVFGITYDPIDGNLYVVTNGCSIRRVTTTGVVTTVTKSNCSTALNGFNGGIVTSYPMVYDPADRALYLASNTTLRKVIP